jgi:hypothetical protein
MEGLRYLAQQVWKIIEKNRRGTKSLNYKT